MSVLLEKIKAKKAKISVIGLGYVGLPTAIFYAEKGFQVFGCDMSEKKVKTINEKCTGCSICSQVCPVAAIEMKERDNDVDHFRALAWEHKDLVPELFDLRRIWDLVF